jgi:hypothetical protein
MRNCGASVDITAVKKDVFWGVNDFLNDRGVICMKVRVVGLRNTRFFCVGVTVFVSTSLIYL